MISIALLALGAAPIVLKDAPFHVEFSTGSAGACVHPTDIHLITGTIKKTGGNKLSVHVENGTMSDYTMTVGPSDQARPQQRNITVAWNCSGVSQEKNGICNLIEEAGHIPTMVDVLIFEGEIGITPPIVALAPGPNPPPPPPPPPQCGKASNQTACDAVPATGGSIGCTWCTSKLHK